jgi:hypothetical protein
MNQRAATLLAIAGLLLAAYAGATLLGGPPRVKLSSSPSEADQVTLYQNGLAFIELSRTFASDGGEALLVFSVPTAAVFDSLAVEAPGLHVLELRSTLAASPTIQPGDEVAVHMDAQVYRGTVLSFAPGQLLLGTANGTTVLDPGKASAIEISGRAVRETGPGSAEVTALVQAPAGNQTVRLSYLARGPGWTPVYALDLDTSHLGFFATMTGLDDWRDIRLDLVSGAPNIVSTPGPGPFGFRSEAMAAPAAGAGGGADQGFQPSTPLGDLHRYHLNRTLTVGRGETVRLPVLDGDIEVVRHYYAAGASVYIGGTSGDHQPVPVLERAELKNTLSEPLPPGVVRFYKDHTWIGEDNLPSVPKTDHANVTLSRAEEVQGKLTLERIVTGGSSATYTWAMEVHDFKDLAVDLRATMSYPTTNWVYGQQQPVRLVSTDPPADIQGNLAIWNLQLQPGEAKTFRLTFEAPTQR